MKDKLLLTALLTLSLTVCTLVGVTVPFIAVSAVGADAPEIMPSLVSLLVGAVAMGHLFAVTRLARRRSR